MQTLYPSLLCSMSRFILSYNSNFDISLSLSDDQNLSIDTDIHAANGKRVKALDIFAYALAFFKEQALKVT